MRAPLWHRGALAAAISLTLAGTGSVFAAEPSNAEMLKRIERLEKKNEALEKALEGERVSEEEPEVATRLKATVRGWDASISYYDGYENTPVVRRRQVPVTPFFTVPPGTASLTVATMTSPMPA